MTQCYNRGLPLISVFVPASVCVECLLGILGIYIKRISYQKDMCKEIYVCMFLSFWADLKPSLRKCDWVIVGAQRAKQSRADKEISRGRSSLLDTHY